MTRHEAEFSFAGIVTLAGTVASVVSLLTSVTTSGAELSVLLRVTVPTVLPPLSLIDGSSNVTVKSS